MRDRDRITTEKGNKSHVAPKMTITGPFGEPEIFSDIRSLVFRHQRPQHRARIVHFHPRRVMLAHWSVPITTKYSAAAAVEIG